MRVVQEVVFVWQVKFLIVWQVLVQFAGFKTAEVDDVPETVVEVFGEFEVVVWCDDGPGLIGELQDGV